MGVRRLPQFLVRTEPRFQGLLEAFALLWVHQAWVPTGRPYRFSTNLVESQGQLPRRALLTSLLLHFSILFFLAWVPHALPLPRGDSRIYRVDIGKIYYDLRVVQLPKSLPSLAPPGPGGRPGTGVLPDYLPARGSAAFHPRFTIVSNPPRPDNSRQTIVQSSSPPDLRVLQELRLPFILVGNPLAAPKPQIRLQLRLTPRVQKTSASQPEPEAPSVRAESPELVLAFAPATNARPHLPVPPPPVMGSLRGSRSDGTGPAAGFSGGEDAAGEEGGLLVVGVDPSGVAQLLGLPPGNRYGSFSISPAGGQPGSPGGVPGGKLGAGTGGPGSGGDGSTGVGPGTSGGGGGGPATPTILSIHGASGSDGYAGRLPSSVTVEMVIPVLSSTPMRRNALIVSAGPIGGGGLGVYGALRGGKIYTIFFPMPGKSWTLEYCLLDSPARNPALSQRGGMVQLDQGLVPPYVLERFDFQRIPIPDDKANKLIILHGLIRQDGSVGELSILQDVEPRMDEAALAAFRRWRFMPALRGGEAVAVEILVGIPARIPQASANK